MAEKADFCRIVWGERDAGGQERKEGMEKEMAAVRLCGSEICGYGIAAK